MCSSQDLKVRAYMPNMSTWPTAMALWRCCCSVSTRSYQPTSARRLYRRRSEVRACDAFDHGDGMHMHEWLVRGESRELLAVLWHMDADEE